MKKIKQILTIFTSLFLIVGLVGCSGGNTFGNVENFDVSSLSEIPDYSQTSEPFIYLNDNNPNFTDEEKQDTNSRIELSELDSLGRCGTAFEVISQEMLPTEERGDISGVYPTGWHQEFYGKTPLWNRTHLLAFSLCGLNDEQRNLITGTSQMNQEVMTIFEEDVREYVKKSPNHVLYRITPDFRGNELVARGVQMEAWSVEDNGQGICFNVYIYNIQDGVNIDYETGYTSSSDYIQEENQSTDTNSSYKIDPNKQMTFIINASNGKFHTADCANAARIGAGNRQEMISTAKEMEENGYDPAGCCIQ